MAQKVRAEAIFAGNVHGVGFRFTTERVAARYDVSGFVRNLSDGTVEVVAEGTQAEAMAFLDQVSAAMEHYVASRRISWQAPTGEFDGFRVRF